MNHVVDTNVLLVASAHDPGSPFDDTHVPFEQREVVFNWIQGFRQDAERKLVVDEELYVLSNEYRNKLTDQDYGLQVVMEKLRDPDFVAVSWEDDAAVVPSDFDGFDRSDRVFLALGYHARERASIVNATDSDWLSIGNTMTVHGVVMEHLLEDWLRAEVLRRGS